jgi:hypothetical protein
MSSRVEDGETRSTARRIGWSLACLAAFAAVTGCVRADGEMVYYPSADVALDGSAACTVAESAGRFRGPVYAVPAETRALPDFATLPSAGAICLDQLSVTERRTFPGLRGRFEWFGIDLQGAFVVEEPGTFDFRLTSDDGSRLYIDGVLVIDNDGYHVTRTARATVRLAAGAHTVGVPFWQGPGPLALVLEVARPGRAYEVFRLDRPLRAAP